LDTSKGLFAGAKVASSFAKASAERSAAEPSERAAYNQTSPREIKSVALLICCQTTEPKVCGVHLRRSSHGATILAMSEGIQAKLRWQGKLFVEHWREQTV